MQVSLPQPRYADERNAVRSSIAWRPVFGHSRASKARRLVQRCRSRAPATHGRSPSKAARRCQDRFATRCFALVTSDYLKTLGVVAAEGRLIDERDGAGAPRAVRRDQTMARQFLPNQSALGHRIHSTPDGAVVHHRRRCSRTCSNVATSRTDKPAVYVSSPQVGASPAKLVVRVSGDSAGLRCSSATRDPGCRSRSAGSDRSGRCRMSCR